jgi:hypothetical protein
MRVDCVVSNDEIFAKQSKNLLCFGSTVKVRETLTFTKAKAKNSVFLVVFAAVFVLVLNATLAQRLHDVILSGLGCRVWFNPLNW